VRTVRTLLEELRQRGYIEQTTDDEAVERLLESGRVTAYVGYDPTADSLHVGNLLTIMPLVHLQRAGHRPIALVGGGTGRVGDPSGKTELRRVLELEELDGNLAAIRAQFSRYLDLAGPDELETAGDRGLLINNEEWLLPLNYIDFLRDIGRHFSVNRMLSAESVKLRLESESGLSFLEFNYSILQAYDFLVLNQRFGCELQMGGSDQWGNIVAGIDLIRRVEGRQAYGITFPLVTTAGGRKMGKTERGAVWLSAERTTPYEYYQFWINTEDRDVGRFLRMYTLLPLAEIEPLERLQGKDLRRAKEVLALEATALTHGREEAERAREGARALFGGEAARDDAAVPTYHVARTELESGIVAFALFADCGLCNSRGAARRMARQGGLYLHGKAIPEERLITMADLQDGAIFLRAGKKRHKKILVRE
jgi:tyrosyl-tRNA synthetase